MRMNILQHDHPRGRHWDLLVEQPDAAMLATWALDGPPVESRPIPARRLPDHRPLYLDYEGPVSGDRGHVSRWDHGTCRIVERGEESWTVELHGEQTIGTAVLRRLPDGDWEFLLTTSPAG